jgi:hypothetical protein
MKHSRLILVVCLLAFFALPALAGKPVLVAGLAEETTAPTDAETAVVAGQSDPLESLFSEEFEIEGGGCSMAEIREAQGACREVAAIFGCTSRGIHWCSRDGAGGWTAECALSCYAQ